MLHYPIPSTIAALILLFFLGSVSLAQPKACLTNPSQECASTKLEFRPGHARVLKVDRPAGAVIVGNPEVADATVQDENTIVITGKKEGDANVIILDKQNTEFFNVEVFVKDREAVKTVEIHSQRVLHNYYSYYCPSGGGVCHRVKDPNESLTVVYNPNVTSAPGTTPQINMEQNAQ
jgi:hypothetical protein